MKQFFLSFVLLSLVSVQMSAQISGSPSVASYVPTQGLVGWWPFNGNAMDQSGLGNHGVVTAAKLAVDRFGNPNAAYLFDTSYSKIDVADAASLRCRKLTMAVWVKPKDTAMGQIIYKGSMYAVGEAYSMNTGGAAVKINSNCATALGWQGGINTQQSLVPNTWVHMVTTFDGDTFRLYKNGVLDTAYYTPGLIDSCVGGGLRFGFNHLRWMASTGDPFKGFIDDIGIWNRALSAAEIGQLFAASEGDCGYGKLGINVCVPQRNLHIKDVLRLEPRTTAPDNPGEGDIYYDKTLHKLRVYDGTAWQDCF